MPYSLSDQRKLLANNILFSQIPINELDNILTFSSEKRYADGQIIFQKGDDGDSLLALLAGEVRISASSEDGKEIVLNTIEQGDSFGEIAFIDGGKRSATTTAIGNCTLLIIKRCDFIPFLEKNPKIAIQLLTVLCQKLRDTSDRVEMVGLLPVSVSLARFLVKAGEALGKEMADGLYLDWKTSQQEIGNEIGTSRESVNKQLNKWQRRGLIKLGGQSRCITILDIDALKDETGGSMG